MPRDEIPEPRDPVVDLITEINAEFMVVTEGGRVVIYKPERDPMLKRDHFVRLDFADFKKWFMNRQVCVGTNTKKQLIMIPIAKVWLEHPDRRQYARVIFDPSGRHAGKNDLNLWRGFAVNPKQGSWAKMQEHIREIICDGNEDHFNWLMGWLARLVQFPGEQGHVAVVLKGMEGSGKGILARGLMRILGQHALTASNPKHLTGQFNGHLRDCIFLFADEAFFAGDRAHVGVLKAFITEDCIMIEPKFKAAGLAPNLLHIMMASNEEWVIPAGLEARRFFVLLVPPGKVGDRAYFDAIQSELDDGGYEAMLYDLSTYDLTGFNHRNPPATEGLQEQKKLSLGTSEAWWMDVLHRGYVFESEHGLEDHFGEWHPEVTTAVLYASYKAFASERHERRPMSRETLGRFMVNIAGAKKDRLSDAVVGEHMTEANEQSRPGNVRRIAELIIKPRPWGYQLGKLGDARAVFTAKTSLDSDWPDDDDT